MHCDHCKKAAENALNSINGISAKVDLKKGEATLKLSKEVADEEIQKAIENAGFKAIL